MQTYEITHSLDIYTWKSGVGISTHETKSLATMTDKVGSRLRSLTKWSSSFLHAVLGYGHPYHSQSDLDLLVTKDILAFSQKHKKICMTVHVSLQLGKIKAEREEEVDVVS